MPIVAEKYTFVVGVDTHARTHQLALIQAGTGHVVVEAEFATSTAGLRRATGWIGRHTGGDLDTVLVSTEGTGSYGATLCRLLLEHGYRVVDAPSPKRERGGSKNDSIDAIKAARNVLPRDSDGLADARAGQSGQILQILLSTRNRLTGESTRTTNALIALLRVHDLGFDARRKPTPPQIRQIARWRPATAPTTAAEVAKAEVVMLARRVVELTKLRRDNDTQMRRVVTAERPELLAEVGIGPFNAAIILAAWSQNGRIRSEAAFAALAGVNPIQIASGNRDEKRLNRGGDRQLNRALHSIAVTRMRDDAQTRDYLARRRAEGLTDRRIRRALKRYIARSTYRLLETTQHPTTA